MKRITFLMVCLLTAIFILVTSIWAMPLSKYNRFKDSNEFKIYLNGIGTGYVFANSVLSYENKSKLYCQPGNLSLSAENYIKILNREIQAKKDELSLDTPVELILLKGLQWTFPCESKEGAVFDKQEQQVTPDVYKQMADQINEILKETQGMTPEERKAITINNDEARRKFEKFVDDYYKVGNGKR